MKTKRVPEAEIQQFYPPAIELEKKSASPLGRWMIWMILLIFVCALLWAIFGKIDVVATARGKVIPQGNIKVIQPLEEGVIQAIHVHEGQQVEQGQLLIELDSTYGTADLDNQSQLLEMQRFERAMLQAELDSMDGQQLLQPEFPHSLDSDMAKLIYQKGVSRDSEYKHRLETLELQRHQKTDTLELEQLELDTLEREAALLSVSTATPSETESKPDFLKKENEKHTLEQKIQSQNKKIVIATYALAEIDSSIASHIGQRSALLLNEMVEIEKSIQALEAQHIKTKRSLDLQRLTAPVSGNVHGLAAHTIGGVVTPAQPVVTIVPSGTTLIVEAMVQNKDIGYIFPGQEVEVKVDTFPFQKYGLIVGKVASISPDAIEDERIGLVYRMEVTVEDKSFIVNGTAQTLTPGMSVTAEVKTGKRRIIEFFLSPIIKYAEESLELR